MASKDKTILKSEIFENSSSAAKKLFVTEAVGEVEGKHLITKTSCWNANNPFLLYRDVLKTHEGQIVEWKVDQLQTGETGLVQVAKGNILFETKYGDGRVVKKTEKLPSIPLLTDASLILFIQKNWKSLTEEKPLPVRAAFWEKTSSFEASLIKKKSVIRFQISDEIKDIPKELELTFSEDGSKIIKGSGRIVLRTRKNNIWQYASASTIFKNE